MNFNLKFHFRTFPFEWLPTEENKPAVCDCHKDKIRHWSSQITRKS